MKSTKKIVPLLRNKLRNGITNGITRYNERYNAMALTNAQRQERWLEKNRALHNFRRRNRKKNLGGGVESRHANHEVKTSSDRKDSAQANDRVNHGPASRDSGSSARPAQTFITKKVGEFRMLVLAEQEKVIEPVKPAIFRNDFGAIISESQWKRLEKLKLKAKEGGYVLDEYSQ